MTTQIQNHTTRWPSWRMIIWALVPALLALPAVAMLATDEVQWSLGDFAVAGLLLLATALLADVIVRSTRSLRTTAILLGVLLAGAVFVWIELAVGLVGSPFAGS